MRVWTGGVTRGGRGGGCGGGRRGRGCRVGTEGQRAEARPRGCGGRRGMTGRGRVWEGMWPSSLSCTQTQRPASPLASKPASSVSHRAPRPPHLPPARHFSLIIAGCAPHPAFVRPRKHVFCGVDGGGKSGRAFPSRPLPAPPARPPPRPPRTTAPYSPLYTPAGLRARECGGGGWGRRRGAALLFPPAAFSPLARPCVCSASSRRPRRRLPRPA
jgi:hypothetical protein